MNEATTKRFNEFFAEWLRDECDLKVTRVTNVRQVTNSSGYCESCYSEWEEVEIDYVDGEGNDQTYEYYGTLAEFFNVE
jgi:hypothetical protein